MNRILSVILAMVIALGSLITACQSQPGSAPEVDKLAPEFQLPNLQGQTISLDDLRGKPVLVNFWATWCGPCVHEMPYIQEVSDEWSGKGLVVLAINIGESTSKVAKFMQSQGLSFTVLLDTDEKTAAKYNIRAIPTTFFIDKDGVIQAKKIGSFTSKAAIESSLDKIIP